MKNKSMIFFVCSLFLIYSQHLTAQDKPTHLVPGDKAPLFSGVQDNGKPWNASEVIGKKILVVYFYPAAMTGGCTKQACAYRDDKAMLEKYDVEVVGVSGDLPEGLSVFRKAHDLNFTLLSDPEGKIAGSFGVPLREGGEIERTIGNHTVTLKRGVTAARWTFIIGKDGKILYVNEAVDAAHDSKQVLEVIRQKTSG